jgi:hypothetical protein
MSAGHIDTAIHDHPFQTTLTIEMTIKEEEGIHMMTVGVMSGGIGTDLDRLRLGESEITVGGIGMNHLGGEEMRVPVGITLDIEMRRGIIGYLYHGNTQMGTDIRTMI